MSCGDKIVSKLFQLFCSIGQFYFQDKVHMTLFRSILHSVTIKVQRINNIAGNLHIYEYIL